MKLHLKRKRLIVLIQMALILKTSVGYALKQLLPETVAFIISTFLAEDPEEQREDYKLLCAKLYGTTMKGKKM